MDTVFNIVFICFEWVWGFIKFLGGFMVIFAIAAVIAILFLGLIGVFDRE